LSAVSTGHIRGMEEEGEVKALFKEVFKDQTIILSYAPKERGNITRYCK